MQIQTACRSVGLSAPLRRQSDVDPAVHIIDDDGSFRTSMLRLLRISGFDSRGYGCAGEFMLTVDREPCGCILLDIAMPGPSGIDLLHALRARNACPPVVFITGRDDVLTSVDLMKYGALDYIVKPPRAERVIAVVQRAMELDATRLANRAALRDLYARFDSLTNTERTIFFGVIRNRLNKQLAGDLGTCERTIKAQRARMMKKLGAKSIPDLVRLAKLLEDAPDSFTSETTP